MHVALRAPKDKVLVVDGENVVAAVHEVQEKVCRYEHIIIRMPMNNNLSLFSV